MTLATLRNNLKSRLAVVDDSTFYDDATLKTILNAAQIKLGAFRSWEFLLQGRTVNGGSVKDKNNYLLPANYLYGSAIWLEVDGAENDYSYVSFPQFRNNSFSFDKAFTIRGKEVVITPTPTKDGLEIHFWYIATPTPFIIDSSVSDFPDNFEEVLLLFAQSIAAQRSGDLTKSVNFQKLAEIEAKSLYKQVKRLVRGAKRGSDIMEAYVGKYLR